MKVKFFISLLLFGIVFSKQHEEKITNPILAMGLSAIVPGAGQLYNGDWKKGLGFFGLEIVSFKLMDKYNKNAKSYIEEYENFADQHWKIDKWLQDFYLFKDQASFTESFINPAGEYLGPWDYSHGPQFIYNGIAYSNLNIQSLYTDVCGINSSNNSMENGGSCDLYYIELDNNGNRIFPIVDQITGEAYDIMNPNHVPESCNEGNWYNQEFCFPNHVIQWGTLEFDQENDYAASTDHSSIYLIKDHHLYEGIGKYNEFFAGWDDATLQEAREVFKNNSYVATSDMKDYYQSLRNKSNKEFDKEEIFLSLIFVNHAVSMFDAFLTSINRKRKVSIDSNMNYGLNKGIEINLKW